jgi:hypothetical protein
MQQFHSSQQEQADFSRLPEQTSKSQRDLHTARLMKRYEEEADYSACMRALVSLEAVENEEALSCIYEVLISVREGHTLVKRYRTLKRAIAERAVHCLCTSPSENAFPFLVKMLFFKEHFYARKAEKALARHGNNITPALIHGLEASHKLPTENSVGVVRILGLLKRYGDTRACNALLFAAQKRIVCSDTSVFKSALKWSVVVVSIVLFVSAINVLVMSPSASLELFLEKLYQSLMILGWIGGFLIVPSAIFLLPVQFVTKRAQTNLCAKYALQALQNIHHKSMAPHLVNLTWSSRRHENEEALKALRPLLPLVTPDDTDLFSSSEERLLANALGNYNDELTLSILHVLECVGTEASLQRINSLVRGRRKEVIVERATHAYNAITERANRQAERKNLLRASEMPEHTHELLRPAQDASEQEAQMRELLRPTEGNED